MIEEMLRNPKLKLPDGILLRRDKKGKVSVQKLTLTDQAKGLLRQFSSKGILTEAEFEEKLSLTIPTRAFLAGEERDYRSLLLSGGKISVPRTMYLGVTQAEYEAHKRHLNALFPPFNTVL